MGRSGYIESLICVGLGPQMAAKILTSKVAQATSPHGPSAARTLSDESNTDCGNVPTVVAGCGPRNIGTDMSPVVLNNVQLKGVPAKRGFKVAMRISCGHPRTAGKTATTSSLTNISPAREETTALA